MECLRRLPFLENGRLIIIDEGLEAAHARKLLAGWIAAWMDEDEVSLFQIFSFFSPTSWYHNESQYFIYPFLEIHDFYTVNISEAYQKDSDNLSKILSMDLSQSIVVLDCLSSIISYVGMTKALWFLERLSKQVQQLICIYRRDIVQCKPPRLDTLGNTYVKLTEYSGIQKKDYFTYMVEIVHRKVGGTILKRTEIVSQDSSTLKIQSDKVERKKEKTGQVCEKPQEKVQSSFRIEMSASEMQQREETALPYTMQSNTTNTSKIFYQADDVDDIDEEDPDDDLCI